MIRQRASRSGTFMGAGAALDAELPSDVLAGALRQALGAPAGVGRLEQLLEVALGEICLVAAALLADVVHDLHLDLVETFLTLPSGTPAGVASGHHLLDVLGLERLAPFQQLPLALPSELFEPRAGRLASDEDQHQHQSHEEPGDRHCERVHAGECTPLPWRRMDLELTDEQRLIRETAREFTNKEVVPRARDNDRNEHFDLELIG